MKNANNETLCKIGRTEEPTLANSRLHTKAQRLLTYLRKNGNSHLLGVFVVVVILQVVALTQLLQSFSDIRECQELIEEIQQYQHQKMLVYELSTRYFHPTRLSNCLSIVFNFDF